MNQLTLNTIALRRTQLLVTDCAIERSDLSSQPPIVTAKPVLGNILKLELGTLGFRLTNPEVFQTIARADFDRAIESLKAMRGGDVPYVPLFLGFPNDVPNDYLYLARRLIGYFGLNTFDLRTFGADPVTQFQVADLWDEAVKAQAQRLADTHTEWLDLTLGTETDAQLALTQWALSLVYSHTPVKEGLWEDLLTVLSTLNLHPDLSRVVVKETLARLAAQDWQRWGKLTVKTPTDILRLFAYLQGQDVSLATPIKLTGLKLSKPQRRAVVQFLNGVSALEEDLLRYKGLWVKLSGWLHPGDFAKAYPKVAAAFDHLRNDRVQSFESQVAQADARGKVTLLQQRPALLLRQLAHLLKDVEPTDLETALRSLGGDPDRLPLPLLLTAFKGVQYRGQRLVINKAGKPYTIGERNDLTDTGGVLKALDQLILDKLKGTQDWSTVWLDPALHKLVLPLQARKQSDGLLNLGRGSRVPVPTDGLRLFVYWQDAGTDLDLSVLTLDQNFSITGHVAFNQYGSDPAIRHSGDIQSAPFGAAEFVDLRLDSVQDAYLLVSVLKFRGKPFPHLQACYAGWQHRQDFTQRLTPNHFSVAWRGRIALSYSGSYEFRYEFEAHVESTAFEGIELPQAHGSRMPRHCLRRLSRM